MKWNNFTRRGEYFVYPKVKVRNVEDEEEGYDIDRFSLKHFESPHVSTHPVEEDKFDSTPKIVRVPVSDISRSDLTVLPPPKEAEKIKDGEEDKANMKPHSFLRPRAVLSSPDNDGMVGIRNKTKKDVHSGLKSHNSCQNRHVQCKVIPRPIAFGSPISLRSEHKEAPHVKHICTGTKSSVVADPRRKKHSLQRTQTPPAI